MRKFLLGVIVLFVHTLYSHAQVFDLTSAEIHTCSAQFVPNAQGLPYSSNQDVKIKICPDQPGRLIRIDLSQLDLYPGDELCFFDGSFATADYLDCLSSLTQVQQLTVKATTDNPTGCLLANFVSNGSQVGSGWKGNISCEIRCQPIEAEIIGAQQAPKDLCIDEPIRLAANVSFPQNGQFYQQDKSQITFIWELGNGDEVKGSSLNYTYNDPAGYLVKLRAIDQYGCESSNLAAQKVRYSVAPKISMTKDMGDYICPNMSLPIGLNDDTEPYNIAATPEELGFFISNEVSDSLALPDGTGVAYYSGLRIQEYEQGAQISSAEDVESIWIDTEHSWMRDLEIDIICPNGQITTLNEHPGNSGSEVFLGEPNENDEQLAEPIPGKGYIYQWTPAATEENWIDFANTNFQVFTLPAGDYQPYEPFNDLIGCPLNGEWQLKVVDNWSSDNGFVFSWGIKLDRTSVLDDLKYVIPTAQMYLQPTTWATQPNANKILFTPTSGGTKSLNIQILDDIGCTFDASLDVTVKNDLYQTCHAVQQRTIKNWPEERVYCPLENITTLQYLNKDTSIFSSVLNEREISIDLAEMWSDFATVDVDESIWDVNDIHVQSINWSAKVTKAGPVRAEIVQPNGTKNLLFEATLPVGDYDWAFTNNGQTFQVAPGTKTYLPQGTWTINTLDDNIGDWTLLLSSTQSTELIIHSWGIDAEADTKIQSKWYDADDNLICEQCNILTIPVADHTLLVRKSYLNDFEFIDTFIVDQAFSNDAIAIEFVGVEDGHLLFDVSTSQPIDLEYSVDGIVWVTLVDGSIKLDGFTSGDQVNIQLRATNGNGGCSSDPKLFSMLVTNCLLYGEVASAQSPTCPSATDGVATISAYNGSPPISYALDGQPSKPIGYFTGLDIGIHSVIVEDSKGCVDTVYFELFPANPMELLTASVDASCFGASDGLASAYLQGGNEPVKYYWLTSPSITFSDTLDQRSAGVYYVRVEDAKGCMFRDTVTIGEPPALQFSVSDLILPTCVGVDDGNATIIPSGGNGVYDVTWSDGFNGAVRQDLPIGTSNFTIEDQLGCEMTDSLILTPNDSFDIDFNVIPITCFGEDDGLINVSGLNGVAPYNFDWGFSSSSSITDLSSGTYVVTATDDRGCIQVDSSQVDEATSPLVVALVQTNKTCADGANGSVDIEVAGGEPTYSFLWNNGDEAQDAYNLEAGDYTVAVTDLYGCVQSVSTTVEAFEPIDVSLSYVQPACIDPSNGSVLVTGISGGSGDGQLDNYLYQWENSTVSTSQYNGLMAGTYLVTVTDVQGCTGIGSVALPAPNTISFDTNFVDVSCYGALDGQIELSNISGGTEPYVIDWAGQPSAQNSLTLNDIAAGQYAVTVTDDEGCLTETAISVSQPDELTTSFTVDQPDCAEANIGLITAAPVGGTSPYEYEWSNGMQDYAIADVPNGSYDVTITDKHGCTVTNQPIIVTPDTLESSVDYFNPTCYGVPNGAAYINATGGTAPYSVSWDNQPFVNQMDFESVTAANHNLVVQDANGCNNTLTFELIEPEPIVATIEQSLAGNAHADTVHLDLNVTGNQGDVQVQWNEETNCTNCFTFDYIAPSSDYMDILVEDAQGCTTEVRAIVHRKVNRGFFVPTLFSPNDDGLNDVLQGFGQREARLVRFTIFSRWGEVIYQYDKNEVLGEGLLLWDGKKNEEMYEKGIYIWQATVLFKDGYQDNYSGETTLIR